MATNERRRERYRTDEDYRARRIRQATEANLAKVRARQQERRLRGWQTIDSAPDNEVIMLYDPEVFWPVAASWDGKDWKCVHYEGPIRPTHWRRPFPIPLN